MRSYIEEWLERQLKQAANERQQEVVSIPAASRTSLKLQFVGDINETVAARK
jgi:hypothetical protein